MNLQLRKVFAFPFSKGVVLAIPGGPGLSGAYMDDCVRALGRDVKCPAYVLDHEYHANPAPGESLLWTYSLLIDFIERASICRFQDRPIILMGHSFGARVALDLALRKKLNLLFVNLVSFPTRLEKPKSFLMARKRLGLNAYKVETEADFRIYWRALLPLYLHRRITKGDLSRLTKRTAWIQAQGLTKGVPSLHSALLKGRRSDVRKPGLFIFGDSDRTLLKPSTSQMKSLLPLSQASEIHDCGHFPMLEKPKEFGELIKTKILLAINKNKVYKPIKD